jgi:hypothetical protein
MFQQGFQRSAADVFDYRDVGRIQASAAVREQQARAPDVQRLQAVR